MGLAAGLDYHQIVGMHHLVAPTISQQTFYFTAFVTQDHPCIGSRIGCQAMPDHLSGLVLDGDQVAPIEAAAC